LWRRPGRHLHLAVSPEGLRRDGRPLRASDRREERRYANGRAGADEAVGRWRQPEREADPLGRDDRACECCALRRAADDGLGLAEPHAAVGELLRLIHGAEAEQCSCPRLRPQRVVELLAGRRALEVAALRVEPYLQEERASVPRGRPRLAPARWRSLERTAAGGDRQRLG